MAILFPDEVARAVWDWSQGPPPDPVIEYYKQFVDREALRENLKLTVEERIRKLEARIDERERKLRDQQTPHTQSSEPKK